MATTTTTGTQAPGGKSNFPPFNTDTFAPQLVWLTLTFGLLYFVLSRVALPRIADVIDERANRIKRDLDAAGRLNAETDKAIAGYEDALATAKAKAGEIARDTRAKLSADVDREKTAIETDLAARAAEAETRIGAMKTRALGSVNEIAVTTAATIVTELTGTEPNPEEMKRALAPPVGE